MRLQSYYTTKKMLEVTGLCPSFEYYYKANTVDELIRNYDIQIGEWRAKVHQLEDDNVNRDMHKINELISSQQEEIYRLGGENRRLKRKANRLEAISIFNRSKVFDEYITYSKREGKTQGASEPDLTNIYLTTCGKLDQILDEAKKTNKHLANISFHFAKSWGFGK